MRGRRLCQGINIRYYVMNSIITGIATSKRRVEIEKFREKTHKKVGI